MEWFWALLWGTLGAVAVFVLPRVLAWVADLPLSYRIARRRREAMRRR